MFGSIFEKRENHNDFLRAVQNGDLTMVNDLIKSKDFDPTINDNEAFKIAIEKEDMGMIDLLLRNHDVLSSIDWNSAIENSKKDYIKKLLMKKKYLSGFK